MPYIHRIHPEIIQFTDTLAIRWYGLSYLAGFLCGYFLLKKLIKQKLLDLTVEQLQDCLTTFCIFGVMLGGRLGYFIFYHPETFINDPLQILKVWEGGMASHGGIIGGILVLIWWAGKHKKSFWNLSDNYAVVVPLGIGFGRLANFINGELHGRITEVAWGVVFPLEIPQLNPGGSLWEKRYDLTTLQALYENGVLHLRHPSQLYQAACEGFLLFGLLWWLRQRPWSQQTNGRLSLVFLMGYALARFAMEFFREPDARLFFGWMSTGQFLSLFMVAGAILGLYVIRGNKRVLSA
ncbi:prolipoprotein diacylglyceryl transferase [Kiritimatiellaeota bacterium B1221]|nr:prolipoprotein diacylglyceryl transferase [Kiritimatiellaeota bacterium B1221]